MGKITTKAKEFTRKVNRRYYLNHAILFGSRSRGDYLKGSDIDIILVSDDFQGIRFYDRPSLVYKYWDWDFEAPLEVLCYTGEEFERKRKQIGLVKTALKEGIELLKK